MEKHQFNFDESLDESVSNEDVYKTTIAPLVHTLFKNGKASCFAYGQTGSGKTYTMQVRPACSFARADTHAHTHTHTHTHTLVYLHAMRAY